MRRILIMSHGEFAGGALNSLRIFTQSENVEAICAYVHDCDPKAALEDYLQRIGEKDQLIICTDILGGSVNQLAVTLLNRKNTYVFAGFNFPLLLQLVCLDENAEEAEIRRLADTGKAAVIFMNDYQIAEFKAEDE